MFLINLNNYKIYLKNCMKKVLLIADSNMSLSGVPVVFMSIVRNLHDQYLFDIIIFKNNDMHFEKEFTSFGGKIYFFNCPKPKSLIKKIFWIFFIFRREAKKYLRRNINLKNYDIVHSFQESMAFPFLQEAKKLGIKKRILHFNSPDSAYKNGYSIKSMPYNYHRSESISASTDLVFVSKPSLVRVGKGYKIKKHLIYNTFNAVTDGLIKCKTAQLHLLQIGTFSSRKNQLFSLSVLKQLILKQKDAKLFFVGKENENGYLQKMKNYISNNGLSDNVIFLPYDYDKKAIFEDTSYLLFPSKKESFGLVLLEAQSCGIHCFSSNTIPTDADVGNIDFLNLNINDWANTILNYFLQNANLRKNPINIERFQAKTFVNNFKDLYK